MKWLSIIIVMVLLAICVAVTFWAARQTERTPMTNPPAPPEPPEPPAMLSALVDQQGRVLELRSEGRPFQLQLKHAPDPLTRQELEPHYEIVSARWVQDDEHGQIQLLQLQLRVKEQHKQQ